MTGEVVDEIEAYQRAKRGREDERCHLARACGRVSGMDEAEAAEQSWFSGGRNLPSRRARATSAAASV